MEAYLEIDNVAVLQALEAAGVAVPKVLEAAAVAAAEYLREAAVGKAPGPHIDKAVTEKKKYRVVAEVGPDKEHWYYKFFETGTAPHEIHPSTAAALTVDQNELVAYVLNHPGMPAAPFLRPAFDEGKDEATDKAGEVFFDEIKKARR